MRACHRQTFRRNYVVVIMPLLSSTIDILAMGREVIITSLGRAFCSYNNPKA